MGRKKKDPPTPHEMMMREYARRFMRQALSIGMGQMSDREQFNHLSANERVDVLKQITLLERKIRKALRL
jgi:hypothetical protein